MQQDIMRQEITLKQIFDEEQSIMDKEITRLRALVTFLESEVHASNARRFAAEDKVRRAGLGSPHM